jgi:hypothetical protein
VRCKKGRYQLGIALAATWHDSGTWIGWQSTAGKAFERRWPSLVVCEANEARKALSTCPAVSRCIRSGGPHGLSKKGNSDEHIEKNLGQSCLVSSGVEKTVLSTEWTLDRGESEHEH